MLLARTLRASVVQAQLDPHCQNSRSYALARVFEATRKRGLICDPLLPRMIPPTSTDVAHESSMCAGALAAQLEAIEGGSYSPPPGRHLQPGPNTLLAVRGAAMDKFFDDEILALVHAMRKRLVQQGHPAGTPVQIVDLGCGLGTGPWRLPLSSNVHWYDLDLPAVLQYKRQLLEGAGAQLRPPPPHADLLTEPASVAGGASGTGCGVPCGAAVPLHVGRYEAVVCHMLKGSLAETLEDHGWDRTAPTLWLAYALLYYLDHRGADLLMKSVAAASLAAPCSAFAGTFMNAGMVELIQESVAAAAAEASSQDLSGGWGGGTGGIAAELEAVDVSALVDPETGGSISVADAVRRSRGVQEAATSLKWGCQGACSSVLGLYGWEAVEEWRTYDVECMYDVLTVGVDASPERLQQVAERHGGRQPLTTVAVGRRGF